MDEKIVIPQETTDMLSRYVNSKHRAASKRSAERYRELLGGDDNPTVMKAMDIIDGMPDHDFTELSDADKTAMITFEKVESASSLAEALDIHAEILLTAMNSGDPAIKEGIKSIFEFLQIAINARSTQPLRDSVNTDTMNEDAVKIIESLIALADSIIDILPEDSDIDLKAIFPGLEF